MLPALFSPVAYGSPPPPLRMLATHPYLKYKRTVHNREENTRNEKNMKNEGVSLFVLFVIVMESRSHIDRLCKTDAIDSNVPNCTRFLAQHAVFFAAHYSLRAGNDFYLWSYSVFCHILMLIFDLSSLREHSSRRARKSSYIKGTFISPLFNWPRGVVRRSRSINRALAGSNPASSRYVLNIFHLDLNSRRCLKRQGN